MVNYRGDLEFVLSYTSWYDGGDSFSRVLIMLNPAYLCHPCKYTVGVFGLDVVKNGYWQISIITFATVEMICDRNFTGDRFSLI